jgi:hypothetical protein
MGRPRPNDNDPANRDLRSRPVKTVTLERFPFKRNRSNDKKSLKIKMLEQLLSKNSINFFGACSVRIRQFPAEER